MINIAVTLKLLGLPGLKIFPIARKFYGEILKPGNPSNSRSF
jgi:hypothetical protein